MDTFYIIILLCILAANTITSACLYKMTDKPKEKEIDIDEELNLAVEKIEEYCLTRTEKEHCRFNLNDTNEACDCMLLKAPPEGWNHADNKK